MERETARQALQRLHPELPESSRDWTLDHYSIAIRTLEKDGTALLRRALEKAQEEGVRKAA